MMCYFVQLHAAATDLLYLDLTYVKGRTILTSSVVCNLLCRKSSLRISLQFSAIEKIFEKLHCVWLNRARSNLLENAVT